LEEAYATYLDASRQFADLRGLYPIVALWPEANMGSSGSQQYPRPPEQWRRIEEERVVATLVLPGSKGQGTISSSSSRSSDSSSSSKIGPKTIEISQKSMEEWQGSLEVVWRQFWCSLTKIWCSFNLSKTKNG
jgi:hypothetical protein